MSSPSESQRSPQRRRWAQAGECHGARGAYSIASPARRPLQNPPAGGVITRLGRWVRLLAASVVVVGAVHAETSMDAALALFHAKKYPEAAAAFRDLTQKDPPNAAAHFHLGLAVEKQGEFAEAIRELERATELVPDNSEYLTELGGAYGKAAKHAGLLDSLNLARQCAAALEKAVALDPNNLVARNGLVSFYREAPPIAGGGKEKAYLQADEIRKRDVSLGSAILGQLYIADQKYDDAFAVYEDALRANPDDYQALYLIGRTAAETGLNLDRGEQTLRRCLELPPGPGEQGRAAVHWRLGRLAEKRGDIEGARAEYRAALQSHPGFQQAADSLANLK